MLSNRHVLMLCTGICVALCSISCQTKTSYATKEVLSFDSLSLLNVDYLPDTNYLKDKDKLDIYMPGSTEQVPVLLFFHGGGLEQGDKSEMQFAAEMFTSEGMGVVFANYRLSPDVMHPAHMQDATKAFVWVKDSIARYGGDPEKIYLAGHSAGAYLAVLMSLDSTYLSAHDLAISDIAGTIGVSPYLYVEETAKERSKTIWGTDEAVWQSASVSPYINSNKPPMLLIYADGDDDWRKRHNETLAAALKDAGNDNINVYQIADRDHNTLWSRIYDDGDSVSLLMTQFIKGNSFPVSQE